MKSGATRLLVGEIPSIDFTGRTTENFGTGKGMVRAECWDNLSDLMERMTVQKLLCIGPEEGMTTEVFTGWWKRGLYPYLLTFIEALGWALF